MAPSSQNLLSPAELAYLHSSLSLSPPVRPDGRAPTQFRPLVAETDMLPGANGSARVCFPDGTEAIVGVKAAVERTTTTGTVVSGGGGGSDGGGAGAAVGMDVDQGGEEGEEGEQHGAAAAAAATQGRSQWVELAIEIPGYRDDDQLPVFLAAMLHEAVIAGGELARKLYINRDWHWKLDIDVLLLSPPLSYPVPLLSLTTHLALLSTRLPALKSARDEDPFFDDDWAASTFVYPALEPARPPVTLLVAAVAHNILFDPSREEIAVADALLAVSLGRSAAATSGGDDNDDGAGVHPAPELRLLAVRTVDSPSKVTPVGVPDSENAAASQGPGVQMPGPKGEEGLWRPPRGGMPRALVPKVIDLCLSPGGVGEEVLAGLQAVDVG